MLTGRLFSVLLALNLLLPGRGWAAGRVPEREQQAGRRLFLPVVFRTGNPLPRINAPYFDGGIKHAETAIFWFGKVTPERNYADGRAGYNRQELFLQLTVFDRLLQFDPSPSAAELDEWDAASLFLQLPDGRAYRFVGQLNGYGSREDYQAAYRRAGNRWEPDSIYFGTNSGWRGNALNDQTPDRGWSLDFHIPFASLGLQGPPGEGALWKAAFLLHDRDAQGGPQLADQSWPEKLDPADPRTWGSLSFGIPGYEPQGVQPEGSVTIREGLNGARVVDAHVGGHTTCGQPYAPNYFSGWGDANYAGFEQVNVQNQSDVSDWPCFSKFYITFPLDAVPRGKVLLSASLRVYQFGGSDPAEAYDSLIQVLTVGSGWEESSLTWNSAPLALENIGGQWVEPLTSFPGWPGVAVDWDVSRAAAQALEAGLPLRLALYSADTAMHSGKYFISSDTEDWNAKGRPTLTVTWGSR